MKPVFITTKIQGTTVYRGLAGWRGTQLRDTQQHIRVGQKPRGKS